MEKFSKGTAAKKVLFAISIAALAPSAGISETMSERAESVSGTDFVRAFVGLCGQNAGNFQRVIDAGNALEFADLPDKMKPLLAPQDPKAEFVGFLADKGEGSPFLLGVSRSIIDSQSMTSCAVANPYIKTEDVVEAMQRIIGVSNVVADETGMGQRYRVWDTSSWSSGSYITLIDAGPMGDGGATLGIIAPTVE